MKSLEKSTGEVETWARWKGWDLAVRQVGVVVGLEFKAEGLLDGNRDRSAVRLWCACGLKSQ